MARRQVLQLELELELRRAPRRVCSPEPITPGSATTLLARLGSTDRARIEDRMQRPHGLFEKDVRAIAAAAELDIYRPNTHDAAQFRDRERGGVWLALVLAHLVDPADGKIYFNNHYVVVLGRVRGKAALVIADPYPGNPRIHCIAETGFEAAWRGAKSKGTPWAAALYRAS